MDIQTLLREFVTLWVVIDPIGTVPVFLAATAGSSAAVRRGVALRAALIAAGILLFFIVCGQYLLELMGISLVSFQVAGSIVLFLFALSMIFGAPKPQREVDEFTGQGERAMQSAVFPVAMPSIASPGAMLAVVLLTDNYRFSLTSQAVTTGLMLIVVAVTLVLLLLAAPLHRLIGSAGENIISRIMGMVLAAVAVDAFLNACVKLGWLSPLSIAAP